MNFVLLKHHNLNELGLIMLFHSYIPKCFWAKAFGTAVWLSNRIPFRVLGMESSLEMLLEEKLDYSTLRVFGCRCFLYLCKYAKTKFHLRCFYPPTWPCLHIMPVVFDESVFPFKEPNYHFSSMDKNVKITSFNEWLMGSSDTVTSSPPTFQGHTQSSHDKHSCRFSHNTYTSDEPTCYPWRRLTICPYILRVSNWRFSITNCAHSIKHFKTGFYNQGRTYM